MKIFEKKYVCYGLGNYRAMDIPLNELWKDNIIAKWYYLFGIRIWRKIIDRSPVPMDVIFAIGCTGFSTWKCCMIEEYSAKYDLVYPYGNS